MEAKLIYGGIGILMWLGGYLVWNQACEDKLEGKKFMYYVLSISASVIIAGGGMFLQLARMYKYLH